MEKNHFDCCVAGLVLAPRRQGCRAAGVASGHLYFQGASLLLFGCLGYNRTPAQRERALLRLLVDDFLFFVMAGCVDREALVLGR